MSERVFKFLKRRLEAEHAAMLAAGETRSIVWDTEIAGFGVRLTKSGGLAFLDYRDRTKAKRRVTICRLIPAERTVEWARERAAKLKVEVRAGGDPAAEKMAAAKVATGLTVRQAVINWMAIKGADWSTATQAEYRRAM